MGDSSRDRHESSLRPRRFAPKLVRSAGRLGCRAPKGRRRMGSDTFAVTAASYCSVCRDDGIGQPSNPAWRHARGGLLFCVVIEFPGSKACPVTARDMTTKEKRRYVEWKRR